MTMTLYPPIGLRHKVLSLGARSSLGLAGVSIAIVSCIYDSDDRCGQGQVLWEGIRCVCAEGYGATATGCVRCGAHEVAGPQGCACADGFARPTADAACVETPKGLGTACDVTTMPCADVNYPYCRSAGSSGGYCTNTDCSSSQDCHGGYACDKMVTPPSCRRPPVGAGKACASDADCAATEATFCDTIMTHQCVVQGCTVSPDNCFEGNQCCDLSLFGAPKLCVAKGTCPL